ncbi:MAG TPA: CBS domain-containing protein [Polyangiaceae bacterium]|nr:CBS domain-containing protein [Polyangiaceae bacterium]
MKAEYESVLHFMSTPVVALDPKADVAELLRLSQRLSIHHFPLVDESGLVGLVCTCDLEEAQPEHRVSHYARRAAVSIRPEAMAREAAAHMLLQGVGSVVVADEEGVWGILTRDDLADVVPDLLQEQRCIHCSSRQHLRRAANHTLICQACDARAQRCCCR